MTKISVLPKVTTAQDEANLILNTAGGNPTTSRIEKSDLVSSLTPPAQSSETAYEGWSGVWAAQGSGLSAGPGKYVYLSSTKTRLTHTTPNAANTIKYIRFHKTSTNQGGNLGDDKSGNLKTARQYGFIRINNSTNTYTVTFGITGDAVSVSNGDLWDIPVSSTVATALSQGDQINVVMQPTNVWIEGNHIATKIPNNLLTIETDGTTITGVGSATDKIRLVGGAGDNNPARTFQFSALASDTIDSADDGEIGFYNGSTQVQSPNNLNTADTIYIADQEANPGDNPQSPLTVFGYLKHQSFFNDLASNGGSVLLSVQGWAASNNTNAIHLVQADTITKRSDGWVLTNLTWAGGAEAVNDFGYSIGGTYAHPVLAKKDLVGELDTETTLSQSTDLVTSDWKKASIAHLNEHITPRTTTPISLSANWATSANTPASGNNRIAWQNAITGGIGQLKWALKDTYGTIPKADVVAYFNAHHKIEIYNTAKTKVIKAEVTNFILSFGTHFINLVNATQTGSAFTDAEYVHIDLQSNIRSRQEAEAAEKALRDRLDIDEEILDHLSFLIIARDFQHNNILTTDENEIIVSTNNTKPSGTPDGTVDILQIDMDSDKSNILDVAVGDYFKATVSNTTIIAKVEYVETGTGANDDVRSIWYNKNTAYLVGVNQYREPEISADTSGTVVFYKKPLFTATTGAPFSSLGSLTNVTETWTDIASGIDNTDYLMVTGRESAGDSRVLTITIRFDDILTTRNWMLANPNNGARLEVRRVTSGQKLQVRRQGAWNSSSKVEVWKMQAVISV